MADVNDLVLLVKIGGCAAIVLIGLAYLLGYWHGARHVLRKLSDGGRRG